MCVAALLYLGVPALVTGLRSVGGLATASPAFLLLVLAATAVTLVGLWLGFTSHRRAESLVVGIVGAAVMLLGFRMWKLAAAVGLLMLLVAVAVSAYHTRRTLHRATA